jgi:hypothetical protein
VAQEGLHSIKSQRMQTKVMKLDLSMAYDRLFALLEIDFDSHWLCPNGELDNGMFDFCVLYNAHKWLGIKFFQAFKRFKARVPNVTPSIPDYSRRSEKNNFKGQKSKALGRNEDR